MNNQYMTNGEAMALDASSPAAQDYGLGSRLQAALLSNVRMGAKFYLDPVNGLDVYDGKSPETAVKTLAAGYALLTANKNDTLYIIGGASALSVTTAFTWAKAYTHLVGLAAGGVYGRVRIGHTGAGPIVSLFTINAAGCIFKNIHWQQGNGYAAQLNCVVMSATASYNYFENCHFDGPLNAVEGGLAYSCLYFTALARSNTFVGCWFGDWTASPSSTDGTLVRFMGTNAGTQFEDCVFIVNTSQASMVAITAAVNMGDLPPAYVSFRNCDFLAMSTGVNVLMTAPTTGKIVIMNCRAVGATNWSGNSSAVLNASGAACIADGGLGVAIG